MKKKKQLYTVILQRRRESSRRFIYRDVTKFQATMILIRKFPRYYQIHIRKNYMESNEADTAIKN